MKLKSTLRFDAPAAVIARMLIAPDFQELIGERIKATECSTVAGPDQITATYRVPTLKGYLGHAGTEMKLIGTLRWTTGWHDGRRSGELHMVTEHFPATTEGTVTLHQVDQSTEVVYNYSVKARVPFLSGKLERLISDAGQSMIDAHQELGEIWLERHRHDAIAL
jgi:hypothetical protein